MAETHSDPLCKIMLLKQQLVLAFSNGCAQEGDVRLFRTKPLWWHFVHVVGFFYFFCSVLVLVFGVVLFLWLFNYTTIFFWKHP